MKRTITTTMLVALAAFGLALGGCKKDNNNGAGGAAGGGSGAAAAAVPSKTGFAVFPADSSLLIGINVAQARSSALWTKYKAVIEAALASKMDDVKGVCGWDPVTSISSVIFAGNPDTDKVVVVVKGLDRSKIKDCVPKMAEKKGKKITVTADGNLENWTTEGGKSTWVAWLDDSTAVLAPDQDKAYVQDRAAGKNGLTDSSEIMKLLKSTDTSSTIYGVVGSAVLNKSGAGAQLQGAQGMFGSLKIDSGLSIDAGMRFDTADNAKKVTAMVKQQLDAVKGQLPPPFGQVAGKAVIKDVDKDMVVQLKLTEAEMQQLGQAAAQFAPMLMSGMK